MSCCNSDALSPGSNNFSRDRMTCAKVHLKDFVASLKTVFEFVSTNISSDTELQNLRSTILEILSTELRPLIQEAITQARTSADQSSAPPPPISVTDQNAQLLELQDLLNKKNEHIEFLEQLIHELQTKLRIEVDKPALLKFRDKQTNGLHLPTEDLTEPGDTFEEISLDSPRQKGTGTVQQQSTPMFSFFRRANSFPNNNRNRNGTGTGQHGKPAAGESAPPYKQAPITTSRAVDVCVTPPDSDDEHKANVSDKNAYRGDTAALAGSDTVEGVSGRRKAAKRLHYSPDSSSSSSSSGSLKTPSQTQLAQQGSGTSGAAVTKSKTLAGVLNDFLDD